MSRLPIGTLRIRHRGFEQPDEPRPKRRNGLAIKQIGPVVKPQQQPLARLHQQAERIVRGVVPAYRRKPHARDLTGKARAVNRIVLEHHQRVEQLAQAGKLLDLSQPKMLVRYQLRLPLLQLAQQIAQRLGRRQRDA